jgi:hypothetical protein
MFDIHKHVKCIPLFLCFDIRCPGLQIYTDPCDFLFALQAPLYI